MKEPYPRRDGIAVSPLELNLPSGTRRNERKKEVHHTHFTAEAFARHPITLDLRDLERHQVPLSSYAHGVLHASYFPPELPTGEQAAREIIDAYEKGEKFRRYDMSLGRYMQLEIPPSLIDELVAVYGLRKIISFAAD